MVTGTGLSSASTLLQQKSSMTPLVMQANVLNPPKNALRPPVRHQLLPQRPQQLLPLHLCQTPRPRRRQHLPHPRRQHLPHPRLQHLPRPRLQHLPRPRLRRLPRPRLRRLLMHQQAYLRHRRRRHPQQRLPHGLRPQHPLWARWLRCTWSCQDRSRTIPLV